MWLVKQTHTSTQGHVKKKAKGKKKKTKLILLYFCLPLNSNLTHSKSYYDHYYYGLFSSTFVLVVVVVVVLLYIIIPLHVYTNLQFPFFTYVSKIFFGFNSIEFCCLHTYMHAKLKQCYVSLLSIPFVSDLSCCWQWVSFCRCPVKRYLQ